MIISTLKTLFKNSHQQQGIIVIILFMIALVIRLLFLADLSVSYPHFYAPPQGLDQHTYLHIAKQIILGQFDRPHYMAPGYTSYFLAPALYLFGNIYNIKVFQAILSALCIPLIYVSGQRIYSPTAALIASLFICFSYLHIGLTGFLLTENIIILLLCLLLTLITQYQQKPYQTFLIGLTAGFAVTVRPNFTLVCFIFLLCFQWPPNKKTQTLCLLLIGFCLPILPITYHNIQTQSPMPLSSNLLPNLIIGLNHDANGVFEYAPAYNEGWFDQVTKIDTHIKIFTQLILNPAHYTLLAFKKSLLFVNAQHYPDTLRFDTDIGTTFLGLGNFTIQFWHLICLALPALVFSRKSQLPKHHLAIVLCVIFFSLPLVGLFFISSRLTFPIAPLLGLLAGFGLEQSFKTLKNRDTRRLSTYLIFLCGVLLLSYKGHGIYQRHLHPHIYPWIHPNGTHRIYQNRALIKDVWWPALVPQQRATLSPNRALRKTLFIEKSFFSQHHKNKNLFLCFPILAIVLPNEGTTLTITINNQQMALDWLPQDIEMYRWKTLKLPIDIHMLHVGENEIDLSLTQGEMATGWDSRLHYNRSFEKTNKTWQPIAQTGELQIIIEHTSP